MSFTGILIAFTWIVPAYQLGSLFGLYNHGKKKPNPLRKKRFSEVKPLLNSLFRQGYHGGEVTLTHNDTGRVLRFQKYIHGKGDFGLRLCIPKPIELESSFQEFRRHCEGMGLSCSVRSEGAVGKAPDVLYVDCGQDMDQAYDLAKTVWTRVFDLTEDAAYERKTNNEISLHDELVDDPDQLRPSEKEENTLLWNDAVRRLDKIGLKPKDPFVAFALAVVWLASMIVLPITITLSSGAVPDWSMEIRDLTFAGSKASLISLLIYLVSFFGLWHFVKKIQTRPRSKTHSEKIEGAVGKTLSFAMPFAVILIWSST